MHEEDQGFSVDSDDDAEHRDGSSSSSSSSEEDSDEDYSGESGSDADNSDGVDGESEPIGRQTRRQAKEATTYSQDLFKSPCGLVSRKLQDSNSIPRGRTALQKGTCAIFTAHQRRDPLHEQTNQAMLGASTDKSTQGAGGTVADSDSRQKLLDECLKGGKPPDAQLLQQGACLNERHFQTAVGRGDDDVLEFLIEHGCPTPKANLWFLALGAKQEDKFENILGLLNLIEAPHSEDMNLITLLINKGDCGRIKLLSEYGCPWDGGEYLLAMENGNLEAFSLLMELNCPWEGAGYKPGKDYMNACWRESEIQWQASKRQDKARFSEIRLKISNLRFPPQGGVKKPSSSRSKGAAKGQKRARKGAPDSRGKKKPRNAAAVDQHTSQNLLPKHQIEEEWCPDPCQEAANDTAMGEGASEPSEGALLSASVAEGGGSSNDSPGINLPGLSTDAEKSFHSDSDCVIHSVNRA